MAALAVATTRLWGETLVYPDGGCSTKGALTMALAEIAQRAWEAVAAGDMDALVADCTEDMILVMPGQTDITHGVHAYRTAVENLGAAVPAGFEITGLRQIESDGEVVTICDWKSERVEASQLAVLFRFRGDKIFEERWFIDTEQWKGAF